VITASGLIRFFHLASTALLFGSFAFHFIVARPALASAGGLESPEFTAFDQRQLRLVRWSLLLVFLSGLLAFWLQIAAVSGLSLLAALNPTVMAGVLIGTRYGWSGRSEWRCCYSWKLFSIVWKEANRRSCARLARSWPRL
jgi:hypothetical protein